MSDVIEYFGNRAEVARALGINPVSVTQWRDTVPPLRQLQIERITNGKLKADPKILQINGTHGRVAAA